MKELEEFKKYTDIFIENVIKPKINWKEIKGRLEYDGLRMDGFGTAHFHNMEILSRFKNYTKRPLESEDESRDCWNTIPLFWKGDGCVIAIGKSRGQGEIALFRDLKTNEYNQKSSAIPIDWYENSIGGNLSTPEIIMLCLYWQNKDIFWDYYNLNQELFEIEEDITRDLSSLVKTKDNEKKQSIITRFKRDTTLIKQLKEKHKTCQLCNFTFKKKDGNPYNEIHHIIPLSSNGIDDIKNLLVLCANCHKKLHFANVDMSVYEKEDSIIINGEKNKIKR